MQLGPYLEILKDIMEEFFDTPKPKNEVPVKLQVVFEAMDRPEFLTAVPKVSLEFNNINLFLVQFLNHQETVTNVETLKASMILLSSGRMDSKTIRSALVAFTLMERYLIHFEDNFRQTYETA